LEEVCLSLSDGAQWRGRGRLYGEGVEGEAVFATAMSGYLQSITDPSYVGQILIFAFPPMGIYGVDHPLESERPQPRAVVVGTLREAAEGLSLSRWLEEHNTPLIAEVDTRSLVRHLREHGTAMGRISRNGEAPRTIELPPLVSEVSTKEAAVWEGDGPTVAVMDYGVKMGIVRELVKRGCRVVRLPHDCDAKSALAFDPAGVILSNGPGDPSKLRDEVSVVRDLLGSVPIMGICLGNQLLALACGARTEKLPYGHRGANHPVCEISSGRGFVTSQNHGYAIVEESLHNTGLVATYRHLSDGSVEGVSHKEVPAWGVQFHPEACPGPRDVNFLFDRFVDSLKGASCNAR
jgi:carbamoyl-phosphate synthase small subunit